MNSSLSPISVLLVDDHTLFRSGIRSLLQSYSGFTVVGEAADGLEGIQRARELQPDVVLLDMNMPGISGLATLELLLEDCPSLVVILLTASEATEDLTAALHAGARGYLTKTIDAAYLAQAIQRAVVGETVLAEAMSTKLVNSLQVSISKVLPTSHVSRLTPREKEILACLACGGSNKTIARTLDVAESTVKIHVQNILKKLNVASRVQAAVFAVEHGMAGLSGR
ncbi:MAG TPA: response regulator transcription factor [Noviherbaspirillum sp.]|nr:response regulator transcription factor [Noviherbaspirillum sp.]